MATPPAAAEGSSGIQSLGGQSSAESSAQSGQAQEDKNTRTLKDFLRRGEEILETFTASARGFDAQSSQIKWLEKAILEMAKFNKRKADSLQDEEEQSSAKRGRAADNQAAELVNTSGDDDPFAALENEIKPQDNSPVDLTDDIVMEMDQFFATEEQLGPKIMDSVAQSIDGALKRPIPKEKMEEVWERNRRPENVARLQTPKIDHFLWDQLPSVTKSQDAQRQKSIALANQALVPVIRAMDHLKTAAQPEISVLRECLTDTFKILANQITGANQKRREVIKQEIRPNLRAVCEDQEISATKLFGDDLAEKVKQVDATKVNITNGKKQNFLGKRLSSEKRDNQPFRGNNQQYRGQNNQHQGQNNRNQQNNKKSFHGKNSQSKSTNYGQSWRKYDHNNKY